MQAVIQRAVAGGGIHSDEQTDPTGSEAVTRRLTAEFPALATDEVERRVTETWICAQHLGLAVTPRLVEPIAREHLLGVVNSVPPSGRLAAVQRGAVC
jgi:hypothetical protein